MPAKLSLWREPWPWLSLLNLLTRSWQNMGADHGFHLVNTEGQCKKSVWDEHVCFKKGKSCFHGEEFLDGLAYEVAIWSFEWGLSFRSRLCHHHAWCCWKTRRAFAQMPSWKHSLEADNQVYLLARVSDTVVAASLQAEAHILQEITLESYFGSDNLTLSADRIPSMTQTAAAVLALLPTAPWCMHRESRTGNGTRRGLGDFHTPSRSLSSPAGKGGCDSTCHYLSFIVKTKSRSQSWLTIKDQDPISTSVSKQRTCLLIGIFF